MHDQFRIQLFACDPAKNHFRFYLIKAGRDLFDDLVVKFHYGRIGTRGQTKTHIVKDAQTASRLVRSCLRRRQSAPKRIGVAYEVKEKYDPDNWANDLTNENNH